MNEENLGDKRDSVTKEDLTARLDKFATLATRLNFLDVTTNSHGCHVCHVCHADKKDELENSLEKQELVGKKICFQWLKIVLVS